MSHVRQPRRHPTRTAPMRWRVAQALMVWPLIQAPAAQARDASAPRLVQWSSAASPAAAAPAPATGVRASAVGRAASARPEAAWVAVPIPAHVAEPPSPAPRPRSGRFVFSTPVPDRPLPQAAPLGETAPAANPSGAPAVRAVRTSSQVVPRVPGSFSGAPVRAVLSRAVADALASSPSVRQAEAQWQAAQYDVDQARGQRWPQVQVGAASPTATFGAEAADTANDPFGTLNVTTPVFDWGHLSSTIDSRSQTAVAAQAELEQGRQQVAYDTATALMDFDRNRQSLLLTQAYIDRLDELVSMLRRIVQSDPGRGSELTQARARRLQAVTNGDQIRTRMNDARIQFTKLVGPGFRIPETLDWRSQSMALGDALARGAEHPSLRQARAESQAALKLAQAVGAQRLPQINWVVSGTTQKDNFGNRQPWSTGLMLQWNAFQGGSASASERAAYERANASEQRARDAERDLEYSLRSQTEQRDAAKRRSTDYDTLVVETDRVRKAYYDQWFHLGKRSLLDVLTAESDHYNNRVARLNTRFEAYAADLRIRADSATLLGWLFGAPPGGADLAAGPVQARPGRSL